MIYFSSRCPRASTCLVFSKKDIRSPRDSSSSMTPVLFAMQRYSSSSLSAITSCLYMLALRATSSSLSVSFLFAYA